MKLVDKLLLGALVILLPLGLFLTQWFLAPEPEVSEVAGPAIDVNKLEQVIRQTVAQSQPEQKPIKPFNITSVTYASESGILRINGAAPDRISSILISVTVMPNTSEPTPTPSPTVTEVGASPKPQYTGIPVQVFSILPDQQSLFSYEYLVSEEDRQALLEVRLDQNESTKTIRFDLGQKRQVL